MDGNGIGAVNGIHHSPCLWPLQFGSLHELIASENERKLGCVKSEVFSVCEYTSPATGGYSCIQFVSIANATTENTALNNRSLGVRTPQMFCRRSTPSCRSICFVIILLTIIPLLDYYGRRKKKETMPTYGNEPRCTFLDSKDEKN